MGDKTKPWRRKQGKPRKKPVDETRRPKYITKGIKPHTPDTDDEWPQ